MYETIATILPEQRNELCADLRNVPELWNQNEVIGEETALFRNRKTDMWYMRIDWQYFHHGQKNSTGKIWSKITELHISQAGINN